jgi:hypothetical protein
MTISQLKKLLAVLKEANVTLYKTDEFQINLAVEVSQELIDLSPAIGFAAESNDDDGDNEDFEDGDAEMSSKRSPQVGFSHPSLWRGTPGPVKFE